MMQTNEAVTRGREFLTYIHNSAISPHTIVKIMVSLADNHVEQESEYLALLEATKDCITDEEYLAAVRAVLQKGDDS